MLKSSEIDKEKIIFLLGGHDLEMCTIKELLCEQGVRYFDAGLRWDNARLSAYAPVLEQYGNSPDWTICGVELEADVQELDNYMAVDHHNENSDKSSALEQVAEILRVPLDRYQQLVAANDKGYIKAMTDADLQVTDAEIKDIRRRDREAQGVTDRDERLAQMAIYDHKEDCGELVIVKALSTKFSPICDRLYPYDNLLIYMDDRWCFYGKKTDLVRQLFTQKESVYLYSGKEYIGLKDGAVSKEEVQSMVNRIRRVFFRSFHIFYFPFKWSLNGDKERVFSKQVDLSRIPISDFSQWRRVQLDPAEVCRPRDEKEQQEACELFGERQYFLEFVHPVLYDVKGKEDPILFHYERNEPQVKRVEYHIELEDRTYTLQVESMNINLYATGVGILSFFLKNDRPDQWDPNAILDINQFGRRVMPPHSNEFSLEDRGMIARSISITGLSGDEQRYRDTFDYGLNAQGNQRGLHSVWSPATFIENLIIDLSPALKVVPVIDDRMLVNCWYGNTKLANKVKGDSERTDDKFEYGDFWYQYVFVDKSIEVTCQNAGMKKKLLDAATYCRWQNYGSLYGISRYSMVLLTNEDSFARDVLSMHMRTIYSRMFELVIAQRASMLRFSGEVTEVSCLKLAPGLNAANKVIAQRIGSLYKEYIRFVNQIYFRSVTAQDQGIEMYNMLLGQFDSDEQIKDLDQEIGELYQYVTLLVDQNRSENGEYLNKLAAIFLPATVLAGIFGMNPVKDLEGDWGFWVHTALIVGLSLLGYKFIKNIGGRNQ